MIMRVSLGDVQGRWKRVPETVNGNGSGNGNGIGGFPEWKRQETVETGKNVLKGPRPIQTIFYNNFDICFRQFAFTAYGLTLFCETHGIVIFLDHAKGLRASRVDVARSPSTVVRQLYTFKLPHLSQPQLGRTSTPYKIRLDSIYLNQSLL